MLLLGRKSLKTACFRFAVYLSKLILKFISLAQTAKSSVCSQKTAFGGFLFYSFFYCNIDVFLIIRVNFSCLLDTKWHT